MYSDWISLRSDLSWVRTFDIYYTYPTTESRTSASIVVIHLCLFAVMLWRYFRSDWPEPLASFLKITVRDCIFIVIVMTGRLGTSPVYVCSPPVRQLFCSGPHPDRAQAFTHDFKHRIPVSLWTYTTDHLLIQLTLVD